MLIESTYSKVSTRIGVIFGILNAIAWVLLFNFLPSQFLGAINLIEWIVFCLMLNISISFRISQQRTRHFQRLFWVIGVALFAAFFCAFVLGFWLYYGMMFGGGDSRSLGLLAGAILGAPIGLIIGIVIGVKTSPSNISKKNIIQQVVEGIINSIIIGTSMSILFGFFVTLSIPHALIYSLLGAIPSVITGLTTALAIYFANWRFNKKHATPNSGAG